MKRLSGVSLVFVFHALILVPSALSAELVQVVGPEQAVPSSITTWQSTQAEHVYGLPEIKHNKKGTLTIDANGLTFTAKSGETSVPRASITAVSAGNQRVELGGVGMRLFRMTIPDGGGVAAAAVLHHRQDMLTVEFRDDRGSSHAAVFFLPAHESDRALTTIAFTAPPAADVAEAVCENGSFEAKSVLVETPNWEQADVPAAYRALLYEHLVDRLRRTKEVGRVYRQGEGDGPGVCPQYTVHLAVASFKEGNSAKRAALGPIGMFVGTTQMKFEVTFTDASGRMQSKEQISATMRGEGESTNVADHVASSVAKHYAKALKTADRSSATKSTDSAFR